MQYMLHKNAKKTRNYWLKMIELLPLGLLFFTGICETTINRFSIGKLGAVSSAISFVLLMTQAPIRVQVNWFNFLNLEFSFSLYFETIPILLCFVITSILVCLYYASNVIFAENSMQRKFGVLNVFAFFMCIAILSNNVLLFYIAVEALGLISAFLVSIEKNTELSATKVFCFNKFASVLFLLAITIIVRDTKSFEITEIARTMQSFLPSCLLLIACLCKGAQMPFSYWLIEATKANIFASILIHAGTIIAVGIIFIVKFNFLFDQFPILKQIMLGIGTITSLWMSCCALSHNDIKKIIACLTISSAGIMFVLCGLSAYSQAILYFVCHAFFKSMLFMSFAFLISAMSGEKHINRMGGISQIAPKLTDIIWISFLFASGFPFLTGFFPKMALTDAINRADFGFYTVCIPAANLLATTAIYRMIFKSLYGETKADELTFSRASKSNEYDLNSFWGLTALSGFISFWAWNHFEWKYFRMSNGTSLNLHNSMEYLINSIAAVAQIAISVILFKLLDWGDQSKPVKAILFALRKHNVYKKSTELIRAVITNCAHKFDKLNCKIAHLLNKETFRSIYHTAMFLMNAHKNCFQYHISWLLLGIAMSLIIGIFNGIFG